VHITYLAIHTDNPAFASAQNFLTKHQIHRRRLIKLALASSALATIPSFAEATSVPSKSPTASISLHSINALVDTLIPADDLTPAASTLGVGDIILQQAENDTLFRPWLMEGLKWLDQGTTGSFVLRSTDERTLLLEQLANYAVGSQPRIFFELLRVRTMTAYYADARSIRGLAIDRPPQPIGYPDFADA
jgi:hypothetical protein